ncbi:MAG: hypothetical protein GY861_24345 [bacterium]|nr:hypothetical protein [bacterium]
MSSQEILQMLDNIDKSKPSVKIVLLSDYATNIQHILYYACNPFLKYHITPPDLEGTEGGLEWQEEHQDILLRLSGRHLTGQAAVEQLSDLIVSSNPSTAELLKRVINKDLKIGAGVKTINKAIPNLIPYSKEGRTEKPAIMLVKTFRPEKAEYPLICANKKDGVRGRTIDKKLFTRSNHKVIGLEHIENNIHLYDFELDGEIMIPGHGFDSASGLVRNHDSIPKAVYWIFDCPSHPGNKEERYQFLVDNITESDCVRIIPHFIAVDEESLMGFYEDALSEGDEGLVVYTVDHEYRDARSYDWCRLVPKKTADCKCIGFYEGKKKMEGTLGGITVSYKGHEVGVGSGFSEVFNKKQALRTAEAAVKKGAPSLTIAYKREEEVFFKKMRSEIWENKFKYLNKIAVIEFKEETKKGSMRQPIFKGWREDKTEENYE